MTREFKRGQKSKLADLTAGTDLYVGIGMQAGGVTFDISCFGLDASEKLSDDSYFIFFNQPKSPEEAIQLLGAQSGDDQSFRVTLDNLPASIHRMVFVASVDGQGTMGQLGQGHLRIAAGGQDVVRFPFRGGDFSNERAIMIGELYKKDVWRFGAVGQGFDGGLDAVVKHFGGSVEEAPAPAPAPAGQSAPTFGAPPGPQGAPAAPAQPSPPPQQAPGPPPGQAPGGMPGAPGQAPGGMPGAPGGMPGAPGQAPGGMPGQAPGGMPGAPGGMPGAPGQAPGGMPGQAPGGMPGAPGAMPGAPGAMPGAPGGMPGAPGQMPGQPGMPGAPGQMPGQPGQMPGQPGMPGAPGQMPGQPGQMPGQPGMPGAPGQMPGQVPSGTPGAVTPPGVMPSLQKYAEVQTQARWAMQNSKLLKVTLGADFLAKQGSMVAFQGNVNFAKEGAGGMKRRMQNAASGQGMDLMRCSGQGEVFIAEDAADLHIIELTGQFGLTAKADAIMAFDATLQRDIQRFESAGIPGGGFFQVVLRGQGTVVMQTKGPPVVLPCDGPTFGDLNAVVGWTEGMRVSIGSQVRLQRPVRGQQMGSSGELVQMQFMGMQGHFLIVQPFEV